MSSRSAFQGQAHTKREGMQGGCHRTDWNGSETNCAEGSMPGSTSHVNPVTENGGRRGRLSEEGWRVRANHSVGPRYRRNLIRVGWGSLKWAQCAMDKG